MKREKLQRLCRPTAKTKPLSQLRVMSCQIHIVKNLIRSKSWILPECDGGVEVGGGEHDGEGDESGDELGEAEDEAACCSWHALNILHSHWRSIVGSASRAHGDRNYRTNRRSAHVHHVKGESLLITETQMRN